MNDNAKSYPLGVSILLDAVAKEFYTKYRSFINRSRVMDFIANRRIEWLDHTCELDNIESIVKKYVSSVAAFIDKNMDSRVPDIGMAGGGGVYILRNLVKLKKSLALVDGPESANAVGYSHSGILRQEG